MGSVYTLALIGFTSGALPVYTPLQRLLAWIVFVMGTAPGVRALLRRTGKVPLLPLVAVQYALLFALPVFSEERIWLEHRGFVRPDENAITEALLAAGIALIGMFIGYRFGGSLGRRGLKFLQFEVSEKRVFWYAVTVIGGAVAVQLGVLSLLGPTLIPFSQPLQVILSADLGVAILGCLYYQGRLSIPERILTLALLAFSCVLGFAGGMFQGAVQPLAIWFICKWVVKRKAPVVPLALVIAAFLLLQPVKHQYRILTWRAGHSLSTTQRVGVYVKLLKEHWIDVSGTEEVAAEARKSAAKRLSLLLTTAHYIELTPDPIPYKNGSTLGYLVYGWIPRALWPSKPTAQYANKILPVEYDLQSWVNLDRTMYGVGHLGEAFVNFGLLGILPAFFVIGAFYRIPERLLGEGRTVATYSIYIAVMVAMVPIGSTIGHAFGGFLQQIFVQGMLLRLFVRRPHRHRGPVRRAESYLPEFQPSFSPVRNPPVETGIRTV